MNKKAIIDKCLEIQGAKLTKLKSLVQTLNESALNESKSTAGDKHDTFRAQTQNEQEMYVKQLSQAQMELNTLIKISQKKRNTKGELGALISTSKGIYLLSIGLGIINIESENIMVISPISPIGKLILNKKSGDKILFRGEEIFIENIS